MKIYCLLSQKYLSEIIVIKTEVFVSATQKSKMMSH